MLIEQKKTIGKAKVKKWGNSLGFIIPVEIVKSQGIKAGDEVELQIHKHRDIMELYGKYKKELKDFDTQKMKDESRRIWAIDEGKEQ